MNRFNQIFNDLTLSKKFNVLLLTIFAVAILLTGSLFGFIQTKFAQEQIATRALMLMETMNSVRNYTSENIKPLLAERLETEAKFISETVPAFSAREVFENFRSGEEYNEFSYKEATLNPTNSRDRADAFESSIVERFRKQTELKELHGFRQTASEPLFYIARPLKVGKESCLQCHGIPADAPQSMIDTYGDRNGFGWKLNEVVGTQIVSVPSQQVFRTAYRSLLILMIVTIGVFAISIATINILLNRAVVERLIALSLIADQVSKGMMSIDFDVSSKDEIGMLSQAFNRLKEQFSQAKAKFTRESQP